MGGVHKGAAAGLAPAYSFSAYAAEVKVDPETGFTEVIKVWAAHDCGRALNPLSVEGQIIGSCHMGLGQVLTEEMKYARAGGLLNPNLLDYKIPTVHEMPEVVPIIVESNDPEAYSAMSEWKFDSAAVLRLQLNHEKPQANLVDNQLIFQYIMYLGEGGHDGHDH